MNLSKLKDPFPSQSIEWRVQISGKKGDKVWAVVLAYVTNRAIMDRLDDVCGQENWKNEYKEGPNGGVLCGLSIRCGDEWVRKWDGADNTEVKVGERLDADTNIKGGLSGAMKRAGAQWGIGRYLYNLESNFADVNPKGKNSAKTKEGDWFKWSPPPLPEWALPADEEPAKTRHTKSFGKKKLDGWKKEIQDAAENLTLEQYREFYKSIKSGVKGDCGPKEAEVNALFIKLGKEKAGKTTAVVEAVMADDKLSINV